MGIGGFDAHGLVLVIKEQIDPVPRRAAAHHLPVHLAQRRHSPTDNIHVEANGLSFHRLVTVRRWKAEGSLVPLSHIAQAVRALGVGRFVNEGNVAQLRRQHMAAHNALGVLEILAPAPAPQDQRSLDDIAGIVDLAAVGRRIGMRAFDDPAQWVAHGPQAIVVKSLDAQQERCVARQIGQLRQRRHDTGDRVRVVAQQFPVVAAVRSEKLTRNLLCQFQGQLQRRPIARSPIVLDQRPQGPGFPWNKQTLPRLQSQPL